jgi:Right handed beta helix region
MRRLIAVGVTMALLTGCTSPSAEPSGASTPSRVEGEVGSAAAAPPTASTPPQASPQPVQGEVLVNSVDQIRAALASAGPGAVIRVADGEYQFKPRLVASASGTADAPITLTGSRNAVLRTKNASGDYGLSITGDHWLVQGFTVAHASKGIVLDGSIGTVIDGVEVFDIGDEAVHFRACSSDGILRNSYVHDTGRNSPQYGEGVYVGSANSNWSKYQCTDGKERQSVGDNTERVLIEDNTFEDVPAEGADLKEGTDSGTLRRNVFRRTGNSGQNSADSAVDAKGNNWLIEENSVSQADAPWEDDGQSRPSEFADGFQAHSVYAGYGTGNVFSRNQVIGVIPGFGIGLYPAAGNIVRCDNSAPDTSKGLVGDSSKPGKCQG